MNKGSLQTNVKEIHKLTLEKYFNQDILLKLNLLLQ